MKMPFSLAMALVACSAEKVPMPPEPSAAARPVSDLPFAQGRSFATLDDYLVFLKSRGRYDVPWYREIRPGFYELVSRRGPGAAPPTFTRAELEAKFGFSR